jgi:hypothetical protein
VLFNTAYNQVTLWCHKLTGGPAMSVYSLRVCGARKGLGAGGVGGFCCYNSTIKDFLEQSWDS